MNFVAIDFETANYSYTSACSLGLVRVEDGEITERKHYFITPTPNYFISRFIDLHGIDASTVKGAPTFDVLWKDIRHYLEGALVAAHYAAFDINVLQQTLSHYRAPLPNFSILCTCELAKAAFPHLDRHKLNVVSDHLGIDLCHHEALSDAEACANILLSVCRAGRFSSVAEAAEYYNISLGHLNQYGNYTSCRRNSPKRQYYYR